MNIKTELHPKFWENDDKLNSDVRTQLLKIAKDFIEFTKVKNLKLQDIVFLGSLANYTYHEKSDVDLHVIFNLSNFERHRPFIREFLQSKKTIWNENHEIFIYDFKVEIYTEDELDINQSTGKYSLIKNEWIKKPEMPSKIDVDKQSVKKKYQSLVDQILRFEELSDKKNSDSKKIIKGMEKFIRHLKDTRKSALKTHGEFSEENVIYKMLRNNGYIEKLRELKNKIYDKSASLKEKIK